MGTSSSKYVAPRQSLPPAPHPIGINSFYTQHRSELAMRVPTPCRNVAVTQAASKTSLLFSIDREMWLSKFRIKDSRGKVLFGIDKKAFRATYTGQEAVGTGGERLFEIHDATSWTHLKMRVTFSNKAGNGETTTLMVESDGHNSRAANVTLASAGGQLVAYFAPADGQGFLSPTRDYIVSVAPNVDASLVLALFVVLDERVRSRRRQRAGAGAAASAGAGAGAGGF